MTILRRRVLTALLVLGCFAPGPAFAAEPMLTFGGDHYAAGQQSLISTPVTGDAFVVGSDVSLTAAVAGNAHLAGFSVNAGGNVAGDLYAAGFNVSVAAPVGGNVTAAGNAVALRPGAPVTGNARLAGASVSVGAPITGSALISAQALTLDAPVGGDLNFFGETLNFGPAARVEGRVMIHAPREIAVPAGVASADRVSFEALVSPDYVSEAGRTAEHVVRGFWPAFWGLAAWIIVLVVAGSAFIALLPRGVAALQDQSRRRPLATLGIGLLSFATLLGLVPVVAITIVGLLLLPFVVIGIAIACTLGYLAGAYLVALRIAAAFVAIDSNVRRLGVLAGGVVLATLLGMVPFLGWLFSLALLVFGLGAATRALLGARGRANRVEQPPIPVTP